MALPFIALKWFTITVLVHPPTAPNASSGHGRFYDTSKSLRRSIIKWFLPIDERGPNDMPKSARPGWICDATTWPRHIRIESLAQRTIPFFERCIYFFFIAFARTRVLRGVLRRIYVINDRRCQQRGVVAKRRRFNALRGGPVADPSSTKTKSSFTVSLPRGEPNRTTTTSTT